MREILWQFTGEGDSICSPPTVHDGIVLVAGSSYYCEDRFLYGLDSRSGVLRWQFPTDNDMNLPVHIHDEVAYFGFDTCEGIVGLRLSDGKEVFRGMIPPNSALMWLRPSSPMV